MKTIIGILVILFLIAAGSVNAEDVTIVEATDSDISENLDLEAVASLFGEAKNLEDFEKKLNDPKSQISNLDLNKDGEVDYLRVVETSKGKTHLTTIQAVIGKDQFQDVATIDVEKDSKGETQVQVVGDVYMYGPGYIIQPVYVQPPVIWIWFWGPYYSPWRSPFYWGYYPPYYRPWRPYPTHRYRKNVHVNINVNNSYQHTTIRKSKTSIELQNKSRRNDYGKKNPDKSFVKRNEGIKNKEGLTSKKAQKPKTEAMKKSTGTKVQKDWQPASGKKGQSSKVKNNKVSVPSKQSRPAQNKSLNRKKSNNRSGSNRSTRRPRGRGGR